VTLQSLQSDSDAGRGLFGRLPLGWGVLAIGLVALLIGSYNGYLLIDEPLLGSDSGLRVFKAHQPVLKLGNRVWLPGLQGHIWLYQRLGLPFAGLKLISSFYLFLATLCLGLYWRRMLGVGAVSTMLAISAMVGFAGHGLTGNIGALMQESVGVGFFFAFVLIATMGGATSLVGLAIGAAAMLTRDAYWFYLFAVTVVAAFYSPWSFRRLRSYVALYLVPILWLGVCVPALYVIAVGRWPTFPMEWPLMYNPVASSSGRTISSAESLRMALLGSGALPLAAALALSVTALAAWKRRRFFTLFDSSEFTRIAIRAAPIALGIVYSLILILDPWQITPGNWRAAWPLVEISFLVAPLLILAVRSAPQALRLLVTGAIVCALVAGIRPEAARVRQAENKVIQQEHAKLEQIVSAAKSGDDPSVCLMARDIWGAYRELSGPLFHNRKTQVNRNGAVPDHCDLLVIEDGVGISAPPDAFNSEGSIAVRDRRWNVFRK
jgi:hypothetical protein